ncbi:MAG: hypothetical protein K6G63_01870, partial [Eubacterium sp.]|nr:hypothetical protein [Eubacterium sp.]
MKFKDVWGASVAEEGDGITILNNAGYNANIQPDEILSFTFIAECDEEKPELINDYLYEMIDSFDIEKHIESLVEDLEDGELEDDVEYIEEDDFEGEEAEAYNTIKRYYALKKNVKLTSKKSNKPKNAYAKPAYGSKKITLKEKNHKYNIICKSHPKLAI